jgi:hypothetical protein
MSVLLKGRRTRTGGLGGPGGLEAWEAREDGNTQRDQILTISLVPAGV